jgi:alanine dehydrogenase
MEVLWANDETVRRNLGMGKVMEAVEEAFRQHGLGRVQMPPKMYLTFPKYGGDLRVMPAYMESLEMAGVKIVNVHPENPSRGLPTVMALVVLNDPRTGAPIALFNGTSLTDLRTGAAGGVALRYLSRKDARVVGIVGAGNQARTQLSAASRVLEVEEVLVTSRSLEESRRFQVEMEGEMGCEILPRKTVAEVCDCDVLITTTPVRKPIVRDEWIREGTHINAIGADARGKEELEPAILKRAKVVVDDWAQASHSGEVNVPLEKGTLTREEIYGELGEIVCGKKEGRETEEEITVFDSTGLAIQDVATATLLYRVLKERELGEALRYF